MRRIVLTITALTLAAGAGVAAAAPTAAPAPSSPRIFCAQPTNPTLAFVVDTVCRHTPH